MKAPPRSPAIFPSCSSTLMEKSSGFWSFSLRSADSNLEFRACSSMLRTLETSFLLAWRDDTSIRRFDIFLLSAFSSYTNDFRDSFVSACSFIRCLMFLIPSSVLSSLMAISAAVNPSPVRTWIWSISSREYRFPTLISIIS